jgi:hypothetical protein
MFSAGANSKAKFASRKMDQTPATVFAQGPGDVNATVASRFVDFRLDWAGCDTSCGCAALVGATSVTRSPGNRIVTLTGFGAIRQ